MITGKQLHRTVLTTIVTGMTLACTAIHTPPQPSAPDQEILDLPLILETPAEIGEGQAITIKWSGPDDRGATLSVNQVDDAPNAHIFHYSALKARRNFERDNDGAVDGLATMQLPAPPVAGEYEIRYTLKLPNIILARRPLRVSNSHYTLNAPDNAPVSSPIKIDWSGTLTAGDFVTLVPKGYEGIFNNSLYAALVQDQPAQLTTPAVAGEYEIRYIMNAGKTGRDGMRYAIQQSIPIRVTDIAARVSGPANAVGGSTIEVSWQGPGEGWRDDVLSVVSRGSENFNRDSWAKVADGGKAVNPASIRVPAIAGEYEITYILVPGQRILARVPLSVTRAHATVDAPETVATGQDFEVRYVGDGFDGDRVVVVPADYPDDKMWGVTTNRGFAVDAFGNTGSISGRLIVEPGDYEIRYVTGLQHQVLARDPVTVTE